MGDRVSISFRNGEQESVVLFNHWGGFGFANEALDYVKELKAERGSSVMMPLDRFEPETVLVDFIRYYINALGWDRVESSLYLGKDRYDGDNSDNGRYVINLITERITRD